MVNTNTKWAYVIGNHDAAGPFNNTMIMQLDSSHPLSMSSIGPSEVTGSSNYFIPIFSNDTDKIATTLYMLDTWCAAGTRSCTTPSQLQWYDKVARGQSGSSLAFVHMPPAQVIDLRSHYTVIGHMNEPISCHSENDTQLVDLMLEIGSIKGIFFGHDHSNDFIGKYRDQILLGYGRKSGYGSYGPSMRVAKGARVILITQDPFSIKTWIRNENGSIDIQPTHQPQDFLLKCGQNEMDSIHVEWGMILLGVFGPMVTLMGYCFITRSRKRTLKHIQLPELVAS